MGAEKEIRTFLHSIFLPSNLIGERDYPQKVCSILLRPTPGNVIVKGEAHTDAEVIVSCGEMDSMGQGIKGWRKGKGINKISQY